MFTAVTSPPCLKGDCFDLSSSTHIVTCSSIFISVFPLIFVCYILKTLWTWCKNVNKTIVMESTYVYNILRGFKKKLLYTSQIVLEHIRIVCPPCQCMWWTFLRHCDTYFCLDYDCYCCDWQKLRVHNFWSCDWCKIFNTQVLIFRLMKRWLLFQRGLFSKWHLWNILIWMDCIGEYCNLKNWFY